MKNTNTIPVETTYYKTVWINNETGEIAESRLEVVRNTISNLIHYHFWSTNWERISVPCMRTTEMREPIW